jgi:hypothetical protein
MSNEYSAPAAPGGDKFPLADLNGSLLRITVTKEEKAVQTAFGLSDPVRCDVVVLDGEHKGEIYSDTLLFPKVLASQLRSFVGKAPVVARLGRGVAKPGQSAPWVLSAASEGDYETARKYDAYIATQAPKATTSAPAPAANVDEAW